MHEDKQTTTLLLLFLFSERTTNKESLEQIKYLYKILTRSQLSSTFLRSGCQNT